MTDFHAILLAVQALFAALFGLAFGSFGTVLATRLVAGESIAGDGSHCRSCGAPLTWRQNIPLLSWLIQRGRCSKCHTAISVGYPLSEAVTALLFVVTVGHSITLVTVAMAGLAVATAPLIWADLKTHRLPNGITYSLAAWGFLASLASWPLDGIPNRLVDSLTWGIVPAVAMFALNLISRGGMGMGDVKLSLGLGLILTLDSLQALATAFVVAFAVAAVVSIFSLLGKKTSMKSALPFGPYLLLGAWVSYLLGPTLQALITSPWAVTF
ncbi:MAG: prepilin peptidase [Micrococcales bacterium]